MKLVFLSTLSLCVFFAACEDPAANKPKATISEPSSTQTATPDAAAVKGETLAITPANSKVLFTASKVTRTHEGGFGKFTGEINLVNAKPEQSSVTIDIDTASVFVDDPGLNDHLKTPDFFDIKKFPHARFKSTEIRQGANPGDPHLVTGDLELHGQTKSITFPATITVDDDAATVKATFAINRNDFGIVYAGAADNLIRPDVVLTLSVKAERNKQLAQHSTKSN